MIFACDIERVSYYDKNKKRCDKAILLSIVLCNLMGVKLLLRQIYLVVYSVT